MRLRLAIGVALLAVLAVAGGSAAESPVPPQARIGDRQALRQLGRLYAWTDRYAKAAEVYGRLLAETPRDPELTADLADLELARGHAARCRNLYARALALAPNDPELLIRQAQAMNLWGDFYRMESIYRGRLAAAPGDLPTRLALARLMMSAQRFDEARGLYLDLLVRGAPPGEIRPALARVAWEAGDLEECLRSADLALRHDPDDAASLALAGRALLRLGRAEQARDRYVRLAGLPGSEAAGLVGLARADLALGEAGQARRWLERAVRAAPEDPEARFLLAGEDKAGGQEFAASLTRPGALSPARLAAWAQVYREHGLMPQAAGCYRAALAADPDYYPARLGLAETLGMAKQYDEANRLLAGLTADFPGASKPLLTRARVLAWSRRYDEALEQYAALGRLNPDDPVPQKEAARTAAWGKDMAEARRLYEGMRRPPVDLLLSRRLAAAPPLRAGGRLGEALERLESDPGRGRGFDGYEAVERALADQAGTPPLRARQRVERALAEFRPRYLIQKESWLEERGKDRLWDKRFLLAMEDYQDLTALRPGNQEAWFDLAQARCALGLCDREAAAYTQLLRLDPQHNLAGLALDRQRRRSKPRLGAAYRRWQENGYGERAQITRQRADLGLEVPVACRFALEATGHQWWELPARWGGESRARGFSLGGRGPLTPWLNATLGWTHKNYDDGDLPDLDSGEAALWFNLRDTVRLGLGWRREDVIQNAFSIRQGTQADVWWLGLASNLNRELEAALTLRGLDMNDGNRGDWETLAVGWSLTDHPRQLKLALSLEHRDYAEETVETYQGDQLTRMVHPYWAPQNWWGGALMLEWRHDLSKLLFCGAEQHYYEARLALSDDNDSNLGWALEAAWHNQFAEHWDAEVRGLVHRSRQWDANGVWLNLGYRF